jgi:hypothetical protein
MKTPVIASEAKQSISPPGDKMDCFVAAAPLRKRFAFVAGNDGCAFVTPAAAIATAVVAAAAREVAVRATPQRCDRQSSSR